MSPRFQRFLVPAVLAVSLLSGCRTEEKATAPAEGPKPLPDSAFRVEWSVGSAPREVQVGQVFLVDVTVRNTGDRTWPDIRTADPAATGAFAVRLSHRWWDGQMTKTASDWTDRVELPKPLDPAAATTLQVSVKAPPEPGAYLLQIDLVQELVAWFEDKGAAKLTIPVTVR
jgi:hypothetical protein